MSAQETTPGHASSSAAFTSSITSNPASDRLGAAFFSAVLVGESSSTDASQPCMHAIQFTLARSLIWEHCTARTLTKQSWKNMRRNLAASSRLQATCAHTTLCAVASACGQLFL
jgi:hypothetical protein